MFKLGIGKIQQQFAVKVCNHIACSVNMASMSDATISMYTRCRRNLLFAAIIIGNLVSSLSLCKVWQSKV